MEPESHSKSSEIIQFIDSRGEFLSSPEGKDDNFNAFLNEKSNFSHRGLDYSVVAILGPQSSGKSTLLNILFGTRFDVMNEQNGRSQTTQGVWMGVSKTEDEVILVMDVEGTDGRERGEDDVAFERKSSLFSLAVASVLIINMWCQDVGRYNAANLGLLKTIFEMNLQLFQHSNSNKVMILFVIRDHHTTPLDKLEGTLRKDLDKIWQTLTKPEHFENAQLGDFFDFEFVGLPHKFLAAAEFQTQAIQLKDRFVNPGNPKYLLKKEYNKDVPADGFSMYAHSIWSVIKSNRDLDLPSQREMLATYRCEEIMNQAYITFEVAVAPTKHQVIERGEVVEKFGARATQFLEQTLGEYDTLASRYHPDVSARKRQVLRQRVVTELGFIFELLVQKLRANALVFFEQLVKETFEVQEGVSRNTLQFSTLVEGIRDSTFQRFDQQVKDALPYDAPSEWNYTPQFVELQANVNSAIERLRKEHLAQLVTEAKTGLENELSPLVTRILEEIPPQQMWREIRKAYDAAVQKCESDVKPKLVALGLPDEEQVRKQIESIRNFSPQIVKKVVKDATQHLALMMEKKFEAMFSFDANKLPRRWKRGDDIPKLFKEARDHAEQLVELFAVMRLDNENVELDTVRDDDPRTIIQYKERGALLERFRSSTSASYKSAIQEQEAVKAAGMNPLFLMLILVLGWNEMLYILSWIVGPMIIPALLVLGTCAYIAIAKFHLGGPMGTVVETVVRAGVRQAISYGTNAVQNFSGNKAHDKAE